MTCISAWCLVRRSSGGICSFNAAWHFPGKFARVHSTIGSYTSSQWRPEQKQEGGNVYPFKVRKEPKRNIRVWLSDGADDLDGQVWAVPLASIFPGGGDARGARRLRST